MALPGRCGFRDKEGGLSKWKIFNKARIEDAENYMLYNDGREALFMQGQTQDFFVLFKYKGKNLGATTAELSFSCVREKLHIHGTYVNNEFTTED